MHSTVEFELRRAEHFATRAAARARVSAWIEDYNTRRRHSACQMMSPADFERALAAGEAACHVRASPARNNAPVLGSVQVVPPRA